MQSEEQQTKTPFVRELIRGMTAEHSLDDKAYSEALDKVCADIARHVKCKRPRMKYFHYVWPVLEEGPKSAARLRNLVCCKIGSAYVSPIFNRDGVEVGFDIDVKNMMS